MTEFVVRGSSLEPLRGHSVSTERYILNFVFFCVFAGWPFCRDRTAFFDENVGSWVHPGTPQRHPKSIENDGQ